MLSCMYHGTVSYITSFEDFKEVMEPSVYEVLNRLYEKEKYICEHEIEELQAEVKETFTIMEEERAQAVCFKRLAEERKEEIDAVYQKLKEYEDLEEQGLLLRLPCKVGDTVWYVDDDDDDYPIKLGIDTILRNDNKNICYYAYAHDDAYYGKFGFIDSDFGKTIFLTKSEAEAKLKELRGEENER